LQAHGEKIPFLIFAVEKIFVDFAQKHFCKSKAEGNLGIIPITLKYS